MEIKAELIYPYSEQERMDFIVEQNHQNGYEIRYSEREIEEEIEVIDENEETTTQTTTKTVTDIQAWGYTQQEIEEKERERKDRMTLTPADVERALYKAKAMDFDDLKTLIAQGTGIDLKALAIEFRASNFYRGAMFGNNRLFDVMGALLGYTSDDIDYLFEHKELPIKPEEETEEETEG